MAFTVGSSEDTAGLGSGWLGQGRDNMAPGFAHQLERECVWSGWGVGPVGTAGLIHMQVASGWLAVCPLASALGSPLSRETR